MFNNLKEVLSKLREGKNKLLLNENVLEGKLRILLGDKVIDIDKFDITYKPGRVNLIADIYKLRSGTLEEPEKVIEKEKPAPEEVKANGEVITQESILNEFRHKKRKDNE